MGVLDEYYGDSLTEREELQAYRAIGTVDELSALAKARDEGRVMVLPCKVGDTVHAPDNEWSGTVGEIVITDSIITIYVRCGGGGFYVPVEDARFTGQDQDDPDKDSTAAASTENKRRLII